MKRTGFPKKTYEEIISKKTAKREQKAKKSVAAEAGEIRSKRKARFNDKRLEEFKKQVRERDDKTCQYPGCEYKNDHIDVHHIAERSQRKDLIYVVSNGKCICRMHHSIVHNDPKSSEAIGLLSFRSRELAVKEGTLGEY